METRQRRVLELWQWGIEKGHLKPPSLIDFRDLCLACQEQAISYVEEHLASSCECSCHTMLAR